MRHWLKSLPQSARAALVVCGTCLVMLAVLSGIIDLLLSFSAARANGGIAVSTSDIAVDALIAFNILALSALVPAAALHLSRIRAVGAYLGAGLVSGLLAFYCWLFATATFDNLSDWIIAPTGPTTEGVRAPGYFHVLGRVFASLPDLIVHDMLHLWIATAAWSIMGVACGFVYWLALGRRAGRAV